MPRLRTVSKKSAEDFSANLKKKLSNEEINLGVKVETVDVPGGHLAVVLTLSYPDCSFDQRLKAESIARKECVKYLQEG